MPHALDPHDLHDHRLAFLARALAARSAREAPEPAAAIARDARPASVALVLRPAPADLELLLIRRAAFPGDPWSGHVALPGGRRHAEDASPLETAVRETREEVGIDLDAAGTLLGRLDDVWPRSGGPVVSVSPFVFAVPLAIEVVPNHEVDTAVWLPVRELERPAAAIEHLHEMAGGTQLRFPAYGYKDFVIWGLTHRILTQFVEVAAARRTATESP